MAIIASIFLDHEVEMGNPAENHSPFILGIDHDGFFV